MNPQTIKRLIATSVAGLLLLAATPTSVSAATASNEDSPCVTTSTLRKSRPWPGSRHMKMTFCSDGRTVKVKVAAKGITSNYKTLDNVRVEFVMRDTKRKTVYKQKFDLGDFGYEFHSTLGIQYWVTEEPLAFDLPKLGSGAYRLEARLLVDWNGDGKAHQATGYKRLAVII